MDERGEREGEERKRGRRGKKEMDVIINILSFLPSAFFLSSVCWSSRLTFDLGPISGSVSSTSLTVSLGFSCSSNLDLFCLNFSNFSN